MVLLKPDSRLTSVGCIIGSGRAGMMGKSVIVFQTVYGNTERILREIAGADESRVRLVRAGEAGADDLAGADRIAVGGPIYGGKIHRDIARFCARYQEALLSKPLALFIGCLAWTRAAGQLELAFPRELREHADFLTTIGGDIDMQRLSGFARLAARTVTTSEAERHFSCPEGREKLRSFLNGYEDLPGERGGGNQDG